ncbi:MAG: hypothetical protein ABW252_00205 [Polyangiales bacterium]
MNEVVAEFEHVLEIERALAISADVDGLASLQEEKRAVLQRLLASGASPEASQKLREKAFANVQLIRHLVVCLQGLSGPEAPTYDAGGSRPPEPMRRSWGRL